jgi:predicted MFS family arabinose efflux permease
MSKNALDTTRDRAARRSLLQLLVVSGVIISLCMGLRQSLGLFMRPITLDIGVSAAAFGFSIALQNIVWGLSQPVVGAFADRFGPRLVLAITALIYGAGLLTMMAAKGALGLDAAGFMIGVGIAGTGFGVLIGVVARAVPPHKRSQTVGAVSAAGSLATIVLAPLGQSLIGRFGWQTALAAFAGVTLLMVLLSMAIRERTPAGPAPLSAPRVPIGAALRVAAEHRGFMAMTVAFFACGFQLAFITTHLPQYLALCGLSPGLSATALGLIGLFNTIGTYAFGLLGARYSQKRLLALIYLLRTLFISTFLLLPITPASTLIFASAMGLLWLGVAPLVTGIIGRLFGLANFNMLYGVSFFSHQVGSFCGAWMGGLVFTLTGAYSLAWAALIVVGVLAFVLQWTMDDQTPAAEPVPA